jgi:hypothetical protein
MGWNLQDKRSKLLQKPEVPKPKRSLHTFKAMKHEFQNLRTSFFACPTML